MSVTPGDLKAIIDHLSVDLVDAPTRDALARVVMTLLEPQIPETIDTLIGRTVRASAVVGYYEATWRAKERREEVVADSVRATSAASHRERIKVRGEKTTEAQITEYLNADPVVIAATNKHSDVTEVADTIEAIRYAVRNQHDGLLEQSRNERKSGGLG